MNRMSELNDLYDSSILLQLVNGSQNMMNFFKQSDVQLKMAVIVAGR